MIEKKYNLQKRNDLRKSEYLIKIFILMKWIFNKWKIWSFSLISAAKPAVQQYLWSIFDAYIAHILKYSDKRVFDHPTKESSNH